MQHGAVGADGATCNVLYKNPESIIEIVTVDSAIKSVTLSTMPSPACNYKGYTMKLKFNLYGFIVCFEAVNDGQGGYFSWRRFDTKRAAIAWVSENKEMRGVCAECQV
jgi:hypothetical protein